MTDLAPPKTRRKSVDKIKEGQEAEWRQKLGQGKKPPLAYSMTHAYKVDDRVQHQSFGIGLVVNLVFPDKMNIFFGDEVKLMKCGTKAPDTRPKA